MSSTTSSVWATRGLTFLVWALAAASATYWVMRLAPRPLPGGAALTETAADTWVDGPAVARALGLSRTTVGDGAAAPAAGSRLSLSGVLATSGGQRGVALIAVDGKPARPYAVGSTVEPGLMLLALEPHRALLGPNAQDGPSVTLSLPVKKP